MLEEQPLDLSVRVGDYAELPRRNKDVDEESVSQSSSEQELERPNSRLAALVTTTATTTTASFLVKEERDPDDRSCSEDSDDSSSSHEHKDGRPRSRPPGTKPYKKNLIRRYCELLLAIKLASTLSFANTKSNLL
jgi:hypothetical protein